MWDLPRPGLEPVSPALAGGFLTTAPPGKSLLLTIVILYSDLLSFSLMLFSGSRISYRIHNTCHYYVFLGSSRLWKLSLFIMTLAILRSLRYFIEYTSIGICLMFFSWLYWSYWEKNYWGTVIFSPYHTKGIFYQHHLPVLLLALVTSGFFPE